MPTYLAPGVYVEEIAGPRTIQGVSTSTAAFLGPCRTGPTGGTPQLLTSYLDFVRIYGDVLPLTYGGASVPNYLAMAVRGFFDEGGASLYVQRIFTADGADTGLGTITSGAVTVNARFPGAAGNVLVTFTLLAGANVNTATGLTRVNPMDSVFAVSGADYGVYTASYDSGAQTWSLTGNSTAMTLGSTVVVRPLSVRVDVSAPSVDSLGQPAWAPAVTLGSYGFDEASSNGLTNALPDSPGSQAQAVTQPISIDVAASTEAADIAGALFSAADLTSIFDATSGPLPQPQLRLVLAGGDDGSAPDASDYEDPLVAFESIDDISIVAAPGASSSWGSATDDDALSLYAQTVNNYLAAHCERLLYRVASLDTPQGFTSTEVLDFRNLRSSDHAALYYPWITTVNPVDGTEIDVPPGGYLAGIWARSDNNYGVIKAPANEVVRSAVDFERRLSKADQELLNPEGVNCLRYFPGPGFLVWGARTISDDPEWKYLSLRRYFNYVEKSIDEGTQWVVFEVNGPTLWTSVRHAVEGFLLDEWKSGALLGSKPDQAYFVQCDASTMTQDDLDNGRLICIVGIAAAKPAEFVIFRISQWTATATS